MRPAIFAKFINSDSNLKMFLNSEQKSFAMIPHLTVTLSELSVRCLGLARNNTPYALVPFHPFEGGGEGSAHIAFEKLTGL